MENLVANSQATIVDITVENFQQIIIEASQDKLVLIDFWADWCEPCKDLMPILEKLAGEYSQHLILAKVDCEAQQEVAAQFGIRSLPTVMVVQNILHQLPQQKIQIIKLNGSLQETNQKYFLHRDLSLAKHISRKLFLLKRKLGKST